MLKRFLDVETVFYIARTSIVLAIVYFGYQGLSSVGEWSQDLRKECEASGGTYMLLPATGSAAAAGLGSPYCRPAAR